MRHIKGVKCVLAETMMNVTCRVSLLSAIDQLPWWLRPALCIMKLMLSRSSVAQCACCLLKPLKAKLLIVTPLDSALYSLNFSLHCIRFCPVLFLPPLTLSHCSPGKWGGNGESFLGVCVCKCACTCVSLGDCTIQACGLWNLSSGQRKRGAAVAWYRADTLFSVPFLLLLPLGKHNSCTRHRAS